MPYPNEHSARLKNPDDFNSDTFKRKKDGTIYGSIKVPSTISVIWGQLKNQSGDEATPQALRFAKASWTAAEAKKWLKDNKVKYILFEPASESKNDEISAVEQRCTSPDISEIRAVDDENPKITGYAAKYNIFTNLGWFMEKIKAGAFDEVLDNDVRCLKNHDANLILGRTANKTLQLKSNTVGLHFENEMPDTTTGKDTLQEVRRGDLSGCSFAFTVSEDDWKYFDDKPAERTIIKIERLFDVGPVTYPAYEDTSVAARSFDKHKVEIEKQEQKHQEQKEKTYDCECIECGHTEESKKHCKDIKCSKCGGQMRRKERPGPGQNNKDEEQEQSLSQKRQIERKYQKAGRIINRLTSAKD